MTQALANDGPDIRSLQGEGDTLVYDRLGEIYLYDTKAGTSKLVPIEIDADLPEVRPRIESVGDELENASISPTGLRAVIEAHGDIFTVAGEARTDARHHEHAGRDGARAGVVAGWAVDCVFLR